MMSDGLDRACWKRLLLSIIFLLVALRNSSAATFDPAVMGLVAGWESTTIYQGELGLYPGDITEDAAGNVLLYDRGTRKLKAVSPTGITATVADLSSLGGIQTIAYQVTRNRLLIVTDSGSLYAYGDSGLLLLKSSGVSGGSMAVNPGDGSFYLGTLSINHYGPDGDRLGTVVSLAMGISQMALNAGTGMLYYSETFLGAISAVDLANNTKQTIITGIGIPGTSEPISVALDSQGALYYFPGAAGLYRYADGSSTKVLNSIGGAGDLLWSASRNAFLQTQGAGANLVLYAPQASASNLTPYVNAFAIAELTDGTLIIPDFASPDLLKVDSNGMSVFADRVDGACSTFTRDDAGAVYAGCGNAVYLVETNGTLTSITTFSGENVASVAHDSLNNSLVVATNTDNGSQVGNATIWRLPLSGSAQATEVTGFQGITVNNVLPGVAADRSGNIYILERSSNQIFKVADGSTSRTTFASNVLSSTAITVPRMLYLGSEDGLLVSTIDNYELWPLSNSSKQTFAANAGAVDNFAIFETVSGNIVAAHSGQFFRMIKSNGTLPPSMATSDCLFDWAELAYPQFFVPARAASATYAPYYYRYYPDTTNYLATSSADNRIWVLGPISGNNLLDVGPITDFLAMAGCSQ